MDALIDQHQLLQDKASEQEEVERQRVALEKENKALRAEAEGRELAGWMTFGVAVALIGSGLAFLLDTQGSRSARTSLGVAPTSGGLTTTGTWRF